MIEPALLGPLAPLVGTWKGESGIDFSHHHAEGTTGETPYREEVSFAAFGSVDNGRQCLYGLDYRMSAWRIGEDGAFHTEIGYWLWDAAARQVMRCFMVPRGTVVIAGAEADPDATQFTMAAELGSPTYGVLENLYLAENASTVRYECTITINDDDSWSYAETSVLRMKEYDELFDHTDANTLHRAD